MTTTLKCSKTPILNWQKTNLNFKIMVYKIKYSFLKTLFGVFSFLADKFNSSIAFVKPKLIFGAVILSTSLLACNTKITEHTQKTSSQKETKSDRTIVAYETSKIGNDSTKTTINSYDTVFYIDDKSGRTTDNDNTICNIIDVMPSFPGGEQELVKYLRQNLQYPNTESNVQGKVVVQFVVEKDGAISEVKIARSLDKDFDSEAVRVIKSMPKWISGKQNGKTVRVKYYVPVNFKLE